MNKKAVVVGWLADILSTSTISFLWAAIDMRRLATEMGVSIKDLGEKLSPQDIITNTALAPQLIMGLLMTVLGGFIASRLARRDELRHALAVGVLLLITSILTTVASKETFLLIPKWYQIIGLSLTLPAALLGGYFGKRINQQFEKLETLQNITVAGGMLLFLLAIHIVLGLFLLFSGISGAASVIDLALYTTVLVGVAMKKRWGLKLVYIIAVSKIISGFYMVRFETPAVLGVILIFISLILILLASKEQRYLRKAAATGTER